MFHSFNIYIKETNFMECTHACTCMHMKGRGFWIFCIFFHAKCHFPYKKCIFIPNNTVFLAYKHEHTFHYGFCVHNLIQKELNLCNVHIHKCMHAKVMHVILFKSPGGGEEVCLCAWGGLKYFLHIADQIFTFPPPLSFLTCPLSMEHSTRWYLDLIFRSYDL